MINATESKVRKTNKKPTKMCLKCGVARDLNNYYANRDWADQLGKDVWCKECVNRCLTKENVIEYFWENHREWSERIWETAQAKATKIANVNATYIKAGEDRKVMLLERLTAQQVPTVMQMYYKYVENGKDGRSITFREAIENGEVDITPEAIDKIFSKEFNGWFSNQDLEYLENYYRKLEDEFTFDNESIRDYARKVCKASLQADKAQDNYAAGKVSFADVKDALAQFDMLSKSANFAACKRKPGDTSGMTSWAELTLKLESTGHTMQRRIEWPKDDVDKTIAEFGHIVEALSLDTI